MVNNFNMSTISVRECFNFLGGCCHYYKALHSTKLFNVFQIEIHVQVNFRKRGMKWTLYFNAYTFENVIGEST